MSAFDQAAALMGEDAVLAFTRVLGAAATNVAEAAVALFYAEMGPGSGREGSDEVGPGQVAETATLAFTTVPAVLSRLLLAQFDRASHRVAVLTRGWSVPGGNRGRVRQRRRGRVRSSPWASSTSSAPPRGPRG